MFWNQCTPQVQATDFNTAFAEATLPVQEIVLQVAGPSISLAWLKLLKLNYASQVKDGGTRMNWDALCPKFIESFETAKCFRMERAFDRLLVIAEFAYQCDRVFTFSSADCAF
jgi:hypothetical protein